METEIIFYSARKNFRYMNFLRCEYNRIYFIPKNFRPVDIKWKELIPENLSFIRKHFRPNNDDWKLAKVVLSFSLAHRSSEMFLLMQKIISDRILVFISAGQKSARTKFLRMIKNGKIEREVIKHLYVPRISYLDIFENDETDIFERLEISDLEIVIGVLLYWGAKNTNYLLWYAIKRRKNLDVFEKFYKKEFIEKTKRNFFPKKKMIYSDPYSFVSNWMEKCSEGWMC